MWWRSSHNRDRKWASPEGRKLLAHSVPQTCRSGNCKGSTFEGNQILKYAFMKITIKGFLDFSEKVSKIYFLESGVQARQGSMSHLKQEKVRKAKGEKEKHVKMKKG